MRLRPIDFLNGDVVATILPSLPDGASKCESSEVSGRTSGIWAGPVLERPAFERIKRKTILDGCKWDPQVGDTEILASFPLFITSEAWSELASLAEKLSTEVFEAEKEILGRPKLMNELGLPRSLRTVLQSSDTLTPAAARTMRFDFHPTSEGWKISEVNSDVPGGFSEASYFTALMAEHFSRTEPVGDPINEWASAIAKTAENGRVGLLTAPGFMEDHQIMAFLAKYLQRHGCETHLANPSQITWRDGLAYLNTGWSQERVDALVRFFQVEWLPSLPLNSSWHHFLRGGYTPVTNPGHAAIAESKRFPLIWDALKTSLPTWRRLLPATYDPREVPWHRDDEWLVKAAMSNTGDEVHIRETAEEWRWRRVYWQVKLQPSKWVAQRRFESVPMETPLGPMHLCVGIYTINGRASGAYVRMAKRALIDYAAMDVALLMHKP